MSSMLLKRKNLFVQEIVSLTKIVLFVCLVASFTGCKENEFPVTPLPEPFEYIPPSDVNLLTAAGDDQKITLTWGATTESNIKTIHVSNLNDGNTQSVPGDNREITFTNLTNLLEYTFLVKVENDKGLFSYGATVSGIPFIHDNIPPGSVRNLKGFTLGSSEALAVWESPQDEDLAGFILYLDRDSVVIDRNSNFGIIRGDLSHKLIVRAVDLSGNYSDPTETFADQDLLTVTGWDDGNTETISLYKEPAITVVDEYKISYFDEETIISSPLPEEYFHTINMDEGRGIWLDDEQTQPLWKEPLVITLFSEGNEVSSTNYYMHNTIPGTIFATHYIDKSDVVTPEGTGNSYTSNVGYISANTFCEYEIRVQEEGTYTITAYGSMPGTGKGRYSVSINNVLAGEGEIEGRGDWGNYNPFTGPDMYLEKGIHRMRIQFLTGDNNYRKFFIEKK